MNSEPSTPGSNNNTLMSPTPRSRSTRAWLMVGGIVSSILIAGAIGWLLGHQNGDATSAEQAVQQPSTTNQQPQTTPAQGLSLDTGRQYGNVYASGHLPVGDSHYVTDTPKVGYAYVCSQYAQNLANDRGGASARGPWFINNNTEYDITKKVHVSGNVTWNHSFSNVLSGTSRTITTNDLPDHPTGLFPIQSSDAAYAFDRNPNRITVQSLIYALNAQPTYSKTPHCMGGEVGVMLTGVAIFNAFDAGGRDAGAWEVQDGCGGHPQKEGLYHYHTLSSCIKDVGVATVIGFALDGFPITGPQLATNNILTTKDLDECHGITSQIMLDGKKVTSYHYVMTEDFPYSVSCFRGVAIQPPDLKSPPQQ